MTSKSKSVELAIECRRQSESCLFTSTSLHLWLLFLRGTRIFFAVVPLILGSLASWNLLTSSDLQSVKLLTAILSFLAGLFPAIYSAIKVDEHIEECKTLAGEFKNLQDRFRMAALVSAKKPFSEFEADTKPLFERLEKVRSASVTVPDIFFKLARRKIMKGDFSFDIDSEGIDLESSKSEKPKVPSVS